ncbi:hypothetical protein GCM10027299_12330 [Larkinella ripae]
MSGQKAPFDHDTTAQNERLTFALQAAGIGTWDFDIQNQRVWWDERCKELYGFPKDDVVPYQEVLAFVYPQDQERVRNAVQWALNPQSKGQYDILFRTLGATDQQIRWIHCKGKAYFDAEGTAYRFSGTAQNETEHVLARQQVQESEARFHSLIEEAPVATCVFVGPELRVEMANQVMITIWGKGWSVIGKPIQEALPELVNQPFLDILNRIYGTGEIYTAKAMPCKLDIDGTIQEFYFDFTYKPLRNSAGEIYAIMNMAIDVTDQVLTQQRIEESRQQLLALFEQSPVGVAILGVDKLTFRMANPFYGFLVGRSPEQLVGKSLLEALPELAGQGFDDLLREVVKTGKPYIAKEVAVDLIRQNHYETIYVDLTYQPRRETETGPVVEILVVATDVTQQVRNRQVVENSESRLRSLVVSAPFPIGVYIGRQMEIQFANQSILDVWGKGNNVIGKRYADVLPELADQQIYEQLDGVYTTGVAFHANNQRVDLVVDGRLQPFYFKYSFTPLFDQDGRVYGVMNTAAEITDLVRTQQALEASENRYRNLSIELERQVDERTLELAAANEELAAANEELAAANEELAATIDNLSESNQLLTRSNLDLEQFAYIASHDLQEPLRKVQQFGDLLKSQYQTQLGEGIGYLERMQVAASRMSLLIRDLLSFSRISTQREVNAWVNLDQVVKNVLTDLELVIGETNADVVIDALPTIRGDAVQLGQLFQNLLSNALKFHRKETTPLIQIRCQVVPGTQLPFGINPTRMAANYFQIDVADNGIGFDQKYTRRIFQVFQRLHGKTEYAGTGVGLAICQKVVENHGGAITATSEPGQGATFTVYLSA